MKLFGHMRFEKAKEGGDGGTGYAKSEAPPPATTPQEGQVSQEEGDNLDEYGYAKDPAAPVVEDKKGDEPKSDDGDKKADPVKDTATGYGEEPPAPPVEDKAPDAVPDDIKLDYEVKTEGVPDEDAKVLKQFAAKHKLSKEAAQELIDTRKSEIEAIAKAEEDLKKQADIQKAKVRADWHRELKQDPKFGGDKFGHNILRAEKVLEEFMPNTKKTLTERKAMLPPWVMRDLATLADHLYSSEKLTQGDPPPPKEDDDDDDPLAFYNQKPSAS